MQKECPGKYHGKAVKYVNDNEKYCKICQQEMKLNKKKRKEIIFGAGGGIIAGVGAIVGAIKIFSRKGK